MISIIIPVFNEEKRIPKSFEAIANFTKSYSEETEVLLVDDGSWDLTVKTAESFKNKMNLKIVSHKTNMGKGAAIRTGVGAASGEKILFTDIDLSVPITLLDSFNQAFSEDVDIVIGSREHPESKIEVKQFWLREMAGYSFTVLTNAVLQVGATDFTCGFKMFRREAARKIFSKQLIKRWAFDAETLFLAKKYGFEVKEVPVIWKHSEGSKVRFPQDLIDSFFGLLQIRLNDLMGKYEN
jgi:dolichyl-phosphate beta-glucosyltransferase